ncbi:hypothetical protein WNY59_13850, partial [Ahrensia kielensis]
LGLPMTVSLSSFFNGQGVYKSRGDAQGFQISKPSHLPTAFGADEILEFWPLLHPKFHCKTLAKKF